MESENLTKSAPNRTATYGKAHKLLANPRDEIAEMVFEEVEKVFHVTKTELQEHCRQKERSIFRNVFCYIMRALGCSYREVGHTIKRHHAAIEKAVLNVEKQGYKSKADNIIWRIKRRLDGKVTI